MFIFSFYLQRYILQKLQYYYNLYNLIWNKLLF